MLSIEAVQPDDLVETAELHKAHLKLGLFPRLGRHFLRHYQETFAKSPYGIALVAKSEGGILGALFGTTSNADHYRWVVRHCGLELALAGSSAMLVRPQVAWTFASTRAGRYMRGIRRHISPSRPQAGPSAPLSVLSHIVTCETERRRGIGRQLVDEFRVLARAEGADCARLVTEEGGLGAPFFERIGCTCVAHRQGQDGAVVREYMLQLDEDEQHEGMGYRGYGHDRAGADSLHDAGAGRGGPAGYH